MCSVTPAAEVDCNSDWSGSELPAGAFTVAVTSQSQAQDTLTTDSIPVATGLLATMVFPDPNYSKVSDPNFDFQWTNPPSPGTTRLDVNFTTPDLLWSKDIGGMQSVAYNSDGTRARTGFAGRAFLRLGHHFKQPRELFRFAA